VVGGSCKNPQRLRKRALGYKRSTLQRSAVQRKSVTKFNVTRSVTKSSILKKCGFWLRSSELVVDTLQRESKTELEKQQSNFRVKLKFSQKHLESKGNQEGVVFTCYMR